MTQTEKIQVIGIYNAHGTLKGELTFISKKLLGLAECALCDLTHGWSPFGKKSWKKHCQASALEFIFLHLEELSAELHQAVQTFPTFIMWSGDQWIEMMTAQEIDHFKKNPTGLIQLLEERCIQFFHK